MVAAQKVPSAAAAASDDVLLQMSLCAMPFKIRT